MPKISLASCFGCSKQTHKPKEPATGALQSERKAKTSISGRTGVVVPLDRAQRDKTSVNEFRRKFRSLFDSKIPERPGLTGQVEVLITGRDSNAGAHRVLASNRNEISDPPPAHLAELPREPAQNDAPPSPSLWDEDFDRTDAGLKELPLTRLSPSDPELPKLSTRTKAPARPRTPPPPLFSQEQFAIGEAISRLTLARAADLTPTEAKKYGGEAIGHTSIHAARTIAKSKLGQLSKEESWTEARRYIVDQHFNNAAISRNIGILPLDQAVHLSSGAAHGGAHISGALRQAAIEIKGSTRDDQSKEARWSRFKRDVDKVRLDRHAFAARLETSKSAEGVSMLAEAKENKIISPTKLSDALAAADWIKRKHPKNQNKHWKEYTTRFTAELLGVPTL